MPSDPNGGAIEVFNSPFDWRQAYKELAFAVIEAHTATNNEQGETCVPLDEAQELAMKTMREQL